ncbi:hypothetical protein JL111_19295 [Paracoccus sp. KCTC 42845]|uniref:Uncharacterized protein n=1 Tax=Paracoccus aerius TaxID=1915382 RepID=A0ABS1SA58_9RHOB|nr:hypothetical protein [Paracoccus aerius]MBL3675618.1 hypothetical protein [Paracoccus aerius]
MMKRAVLTDREIKCSLLFENPPWRLGKIIPLRNGTFDVVMMHEDGESRTVNVAADYSSLMKRFEGW